jgi:(1->4)-alpha-D-glucan 1-alpha-D-glucosylmutase
VRARLAVLSEIPGQWAAAVQRWRTRADVGWGDIAPDRAFEYAMWQTLVGAWPLSHDRARTWAQKATREARVRTSWRHPEAAYEAARDQWLAHVYEDRVLLDEIASFASELAPHGARNSLAQTLVKLTAPGIPDFYQGSELRDDSLVDPDNRRAVDLVVRARMLRELAGASVEQLVSISDDLGAMKLWMIQRVLAVPRALDEAYEPLAAIGPHAHRVFAFLRGRAITAVPRLGVHAKGWANTMLQLPEGPWRDVLSERTHTGGVPIRELWARFPVALLVSSTKP